MLPATYAVSTLPNGLRIGTATLPGRQSAAIGVWTSVGSRHEPARIAGIAHLVEHMVFKGTARRSARKISLDIEGVGGEINAFTSEDHTCYHAVVPAPRLADAADVLADLFRNARFSQTDLAREKQVILEEIQMYRENPGQHVDDLLSSALWPGHPLGRLITGTPRSLAALTTADLRAWTDRNHTAANALVAVASPLDHHEVIALLIPLFSALPAGKPAKARRFTRPSRKPAVLTDTRDDIEQTHVALGFRTPGRNHHGRHALRLLSVALGETMGSRLFHSLREQRGLCYSINSETDLFDETGLLEIYTAVENSRLEAAMRALGTELNRVRTQPPRGRELIRAREFTLGQQALWFESTTNQMNWVAESLLNHPAIVSPESVVKKLLAVTPEHIAAAAGSILRPSRAAAAIIGPAAATSPLFSWLDLR